MLVSAPLYVADSVLSDLNTSVIKRRDIVAVIQLILLKRKQMIPKIDKLCSKLKYNIIKKKQSEVMGDRTVCVPWEVCMK